MRLISIGDRVRPGTYRLHSLFRHAVNFTDGRRLVTLVTPDVGAGPVNIVIRDITPFALLRIPAPEFAATPASGPVTARNPNSSPAPHLAAFLSPDARGGRSTPEYHLGHPRNGNEHLHVERDSIVFANRRLSLSAAQSYGSLLHIEKETSRTVFRRNLKIVENILIKESHPRSLSLLLDTKRERNFRTAFERALVARIKEGASRMFPVAGGGNPGGPRSATAATQEGIRLLAGCGFGLTPSGDDFIAGMLIGLNVVQLLTGRSRRTLAKRLLAAAEGDNLLSNSFLALAHSGRVTEPMQAFVSALASRASADLARHTRRVMAAGETSGADLLTGFVMTVKRY